MSDLGGGRPAVRNGGSWSCTPSRERTGLLWWVPEYVWILVSYGCLLGMSAPRAFMSVVMKVRNDTDTTFNPPIVIAVVLRLFDGNPPPDWPGPFTLNSNDYWRIEGVSVSFLIFISMDINEEQT